jgi:hypothetical protein
VCVSKGYLISKKFKKENFYINMLNLFIRAFIGFYLFFNFIHSTHDVDVDVDAEFFPITHLEMPKDLILDYMHIRLNDIYRGEEKMFLKGQ